MVWNDSLQLFAEGQEHRTLGSGMVLGMVLVRVEGGTPHTLGRDAGRVFYPGLRVTGNLEEMRRDVRCVLWQ